MRLLITIALLLCMLGCATKGDIEDLKKQIDQIKTERAQHQEQLKNALDAAENTSSLCRLDSAQTFESDWKGNSSEVKGQPGMRSGNREILNRLHEEEFKRNAECQRDYENVIQKLRLLYGSGS